MSSIARHNTRSGRWRAPVLFLAVTILFILEGTTKNAMFSGSWNTALIILNTGLISAVVALGINIQWGYAGLFNVGVVGFLALGGLAPVLIATPPTPGAWDAGGMRLLIALLFGTGVLALAALARQKLPQTWWRGLLIAGIIIGGYLAYRAILDPATEGIEANPVSNNGSIGGLGLPVLFSWAFGGVLAALAAWAIGKVALGLRSDYLAIATLGIGEIIVAVLKNENWLARGVKNVSGIPRPVPYEIQLQANPEFRQMATDLGFGVAEASGIWVKLGYSALFVAVLLTVILLCELAWKSPWGRMMRAIRDNETAALAMGKDVTRRHLQVFVLGSAVIGIAGAMMITQDGLMAPVAYNPLRYTFLIWVMVIVGGAGNNWGVVLGALLIWFSWMKVEAWGPKLMAFLTQPLPAGAVRDHLMTSAPHMRYIVMGVILLLVLRFAPRGLLPEE